MCFCAWLPPMLTDSPCTWISIFKFQLAPTGTCCQAVPVWVSLRSQLSLQDWALESLIIPLFFRDSHLHWAGAPKPRQGSPGLPWVSPRPRCELVELRCLWGRFVRWDATVSVLERLSLEATRPMSGFPWSPSRYIKLETALLAILTETQLYWRR